MTTYLYQGRKVHLVAGRDADPTADVWVAFDDDPDRDAIVAPDELEVLNPELEKIAHGALGLDTLADRGGDDVDFHDLHVAGIREALELAYAAGAAAASRPGPQAERARVQRDEVLARLEIERSRR